MAVAKATVPVEFWKRAGIVEGLLTRKLCLGTERGDCSGKIVSAHTIPHSQLQKIALDGHVYAVLYSAFDLAKNDGKPSVGKRGIRQFSTLNCFCEKHDNDLFSPVEDQPLTFTEEQILLLHYRALGAEMYKKEATVESIATHIRDYAKKSDLFATSKRNYLELTKKQQELGLRDLKVSFARTSKALEEKKYGEISALVLHFEKPPTIMTVGAFAPEYDYNQARLQTLGTEETVAEHVSLSILSPEGPACCCLIWPKQSSLGRKFADALLQQKAEHLTTLLILTAFEFLENTCMNIPWWDALREAERKVLRETMMPPAEFNIQQPSNCLTFGGVKFDDWKFSRHIFRNA